MQTPICAVYWCLHTNPPCAVYGCCEVPSLHTTALSNPILLSRVAAKMQAMGAASTRTVNLHLNELRSVFFFLKASFLLFGYSCVFMYFQETPEKLLISLPLPAG